MIPIGRLLACVGLALGLLAAPARAADDDLYLRIETGEHEADINHLAIVPGGVGSGGVGPDGVGSGGVVVTVSDDKTTRLWAADTLAPLAVLRPPIGPHDDGALYAVAASAERIAMAGRTGDGKGRFAVHLFAAAGQRPLGNIAGMAQPITALRFSPAGPLGGNLLAVGMQDRGGLRLFDLKAMTELRGDPDYQGSITSLDFDGQGRLAVASADGRVRLYAADLRRVASVALPGGARPWGVAFSADGKRIAVGDRQRALVHLLDGTTLKPLRTLDGGAANQPGGSRQGSFNVVAFGADGTLFAAGSYKDAGGARLLRAWSADGKPRFEAKLATDTVTDLLATADGVIFASAQPSLGRVDVAGHVTVLRQSRHMELRDVGESQFRISSTGAAIELPAGPNGERMVFDAEARELRPADAAAAVVLTAPAARGTAITVTDWKNSHVPKVNGVALRLEPAETARAVAVSPTQRAAAIGTDFFLRFVAPDRELWHRVAAAPVWAVNVSADGTRVIAGLGDGTVHWYSAATGEELLSLFIEPASQRWVLWTPEGFFDHDHRSDGQPDGRSLIGYQRNTADRRSGEFVEIGQLYPVFFRPDLVGLSLRDTVAARQAVADQRERLGNVATILGRGLPPMLTLLESCGREAGARASGCPSARLLDKPASGAAPMETAAETLLVQYRLQARGGETGRVVLRRNDAVIAPTIFVSEEAPRLRVEEAVVPLGEGLNVIRVTPVNATGEVEASAQESMEIRVLRVASAARSAGAQGAGATIQGRRPAVRPPVTLHVLSVGVGKFRRSELNLANPVNDARGIAQLMQGASPPVYDSASVTLLTDEEATSEKILAALHAIAEKALPDDLVFIFMAGHGQQVDGRYYYAPVDFGMKDEALFRRALGGAAQGGDRALAELFRHEGLGQEKMLPAIQAIQAARVAMILDTCFSASIATQDAVSRRDINATVTNTLGHAAGRFVLSSATSLALDSAGPAADLPRDAEGHGLFTSFVLRALRGEADFDRAGRIDIYKLATFTKRHVEQATADMRQPQQPAFFFAGSQFFDLRAVAARP